MTSIELAASDAAATALSLPHADPETAQSLAVIAAYEAVRDAGFGRATAEMVASRIVAEMTWDGNLHDSRGASFDACSNSRH